MKPLLHRGIRNASEWPAIDAHPRSKLSFANNTMASVLQPPPSQAVESLTMPLNRLQLVHPSSYDAEADTRSRDEILAERKSRKIQQKKERDQQRLDSRIEQMRAPKCDKIKIIDRNEAARIMNAASASSKPFDRGESRRSRNAPHDLAEFLGTNLTATTHRQFYAATEATVQVKPSVERVRPKGKTREVPRPKNKSQLKKNILKSREVRRVDGNDAAAQTPVAADADTGANDDPDETSDSECIADSSTTEFSRKFRPYCNNRISTELCEATENLLRDIFNFQHRAYNDNHIKARAHKRFVVGFKEAQRQLHIDKIKLLIVAPDLEPTSTDDFGGGLDNLIAGLKAMCEAKEVPVPYVFSIRRWKLGRIMMKKVPVSCVGIINYEGSEDNFRRLLALINVHRKTKSME